MVKVRYDLMNLVDSLVQAVRESNSVLRQQYAIQRIKLQNNTILARLYEPGLSECIQVAVLDARMPCYEALPFRALFFRKGIAVNQLNLALGYPSFWLKALGLYRLHAIHIELLITKNTISVSCHLAEAGPTLQEN